MTFNVKVAREALASQLKVQGRGGSISPMTLVPVELMILLSGQKNGHRLDHFRHASVCKHFVEKCNRQERCHASTNQ